MVIPPPTAAPDLLCFSHLRWNFVFQRPQHLMTRCAKDRRVFFYEEPVFGERTMPSLRVDVDGGVIVATPHLPAGQSTASTNAALASLLDQLMHDARIDEYVAWYYSPMALAFTSHLTPLAIIYDCMDELSAFKGAPPDLATRESELLERAALVLTGGRALYEAKKHRHHNIHPFPSSVDVPHFAQARHLTTEPPDQAMVPHPRLGFFGVLDERLDLDLVAGTAAARPDWHLVMIGPVVKIDPASLPSAPNVHYLGSKRYEELPAYIAGWDVALLPFARNDATRFISPTKTPEYLAAGKPVVSTSIRDVVRPYGERRLVRIADEVDPFVDACAAAMAEDATGRRARADAFLRQTSWDSTWHRIRLLMDEACVMPPRDIDATGAAAI